MARETPHIAVIGAGHPGATEDPRAVALGRALAEEGAVLVCGGLSGVMEAACRGAREAGGTTVGILPGPDRSAANPFVDVAVATGLGELRNALVVRTADAIIAVGGGYGTLSEIALALKAAVPVVALGTWQLGRDDRFLSPDPLVRVEDPAAAVREALRLSRLL